MLAKVVISKGTMPSDGFSAKILNVSYPERKARFISEQNMAIFRPVSGWINLESPSSFNKISEEESEGPFEFNTEGPDVFHTYWMVSCLLDKAEIRESLI